MKRRVLFICTGNLCRSPIAEGILKQKLSERGIDSVCVSSAGTFAMKGRPAAELAVEVAADRGVDLTEHSSDHITRQSLADADMVIGMERDHIVEANIVLKDPGEKYHLLSDFGPRRIRGQDIEDPYGAPKDYFEFAYAEIERCVISLLDDIIERWDIEV